MLEPHVDAVMVDKGFSIGEVCAKHFIEIVRTPFLRMKPQFPPSEMKQSHKISSARVHIECVIQCIEVFGIFKSTFPYKLLKLFEHMLIIGAALTNLSSPILGDFLLIPSPMIYIVQMMINIVQMNILCK